MEYALYFTYRCNLSCEYCFIKNFVGSEDKENKTITPETIKQVCQYIENDIKTNAREDNWLAFSGGEPCMEPGVILDLMAGTSHLNLRYAMYTNGMLLNRLPDELLEKMHCFLIAIEGDKKIHESYKPTGSYDKILSNVKEIKRRTTAETIARLTIQENSNICRSVGDLADHFDFVYWQIVNKDSFDNPKAFIDNYTLNIPKLFDSWKEALKRGRVLNYIPFSRIVLSQIENKTIPSFWCGSGSDHQAIDMHGNIYTCDEFLD